LKFVVGSTEPALIHLAKELFCDLPEPRNAQGDIPCFMLTPSGTDAALYDITGPALGVLTGAPLAKALAWMVAGVNRSVLDLEPTRLHLHAAAAVKHDRAAILAAPRETGKTTTLARLVLAGWAFISDETVSIAASDEHVRGYPKPISIKPGSRPLLSELADNFLPPGDVGEDAVLHVSLGATGAEMRTEARPHLVALLRRSPRNRSHEHGSYALHPVDAVVRLMAETLDAGRFGPRAVHELARLAARCHCHEVIVSTPDGTVAEIEQLFARSAPDVLEVEELVGGERVEPNVVSLLIGDRVVIHGPPEGPILALDPAGSEVWLQIGGWQTTSHIDLRGPMVAPFVQQLIDLRLVTQ
jgi:hypothetical protein